MTEVWTEQCAARCSSGIGVVDIVGEVIYLLALCELDRANKVVWTTFASRPTARIVKDSFHGVRSAFCVRAWYND